MKNFIILLLLTGLFSCADKQASDQLKSLNQTINATELNLEYLKKHTAYFTINNNVFEGKGKKIIENFINQSQFIVYGEMHDSKQTSIITKAFIPLLKQAGFDYFALEVGPTSAKMLTKLSKPVEKTIENLHAFNTKYALTEFEEVDYPIPFFTGISDAEFLQEASANRIELWGLDQEYYSASFFLLDVLLETAITNPNFDKIKILKEKAHQTMIKHFMKELANDDYETYKNIIEDKNVVNFFNSFNKANIRAQQIINDLQTSWDIYIRWRDDSHVDRISYMRNNYIKHYNSVSETKKLPKVFTKIGSLHASKLISNGAYDIGHLTEELAQKNGTYSTNINTWKPFEVENDSIINNLERYKRSFKRYKLFTDLSKKDKWTIINLKDIRKDLKEGILTLPTNGDYHRLKKLIESYDYQIILPVETLFSFPLVFKRIKWDFFMQTI